MCVIIDVAENVTIPFEKLDSAVIHNKDGYGLVAFDRGKLEVFREVPEKGNDAEAIAKRLEQYKGLQYFLHLRYATHGDVNLDNCHPFQVLDKKNFGSDMFLMHNGVLSGYGNYKSGKSDTVEFCDEIVRPLLESAACAHDVEDLLILPYVEKILDKFAGSNRLLLVDSHQKVMHVGNWVKVGDLYCSNNSYFADGKYRPASNVTSYHGHWKSTNYYSGTHKPSSTNSSTAVATGMEDVKRTPANFRDIVVTSRTVSPYKEPTLVSKNVDYIKLTDALGIESLEDLTILDPDDIAEMVKYHPEASIMIIQQLLYALYEDSLDSEAYEDYTDDDVVTEE